MSNVFKLGKGPEYGHVNCSLFIFQKIARPAFGNFVKSTHRYLRCDLRHPVKMSDLSIFNYLDLHLSALGCMIDYINKQKGENSWHMT